MPEITNRDTGEVLVFATDEELHAARTKLLTDWYQAVEAAKSAKSIIEKEQALRKEVASMFFSEPEEGTNVYELDAGYKLKLTYKLDRKIDEAALEAVRTQLKEDNISIDTLLTYKPSLDTKAYKGLCQISPEAAKVFDQCLTIKPASPTLEVVAPKS